MLWVDGNNVRGIGKFEWNSVELQHRVVRFCHMHRIEKAVVVWDHGTAPFASSARYSFDDSGAVREDENHGFCVDLVILFSGLSQRADDVLVKESNHLVTSSFQEEDAKTSSAKLDWGSLAFVTNDRDLNYKLRKQSTPNPPSIRLSRRKRRDNGKVYDADTTAASSSKETESNTKANPLFCDSTGFVDLLSDLPIDYDMVLSPIEAKASKSIEAAKASIRECSKSQRRGYNPRREKTWERCVQAETLRRLLGGGSSHSKTEQIKSQRSSSKDENSSFVASYLKELHGTRGYSIAIEGDSNKGGDTENEFSPFLGPSRLDKHQRRLLARFNALVRDGEIA